MSKQVCALFLIAFLTGCSYFTSDKVYKSPQGSITLSAKACTSEKVKGTVPPEIQSKLKEAKVEPAGMGVIKGCWVDAEDVPDAGFPPDTVFVIADNGGYALFPKSQFK